MEGNTVTDQFIPNPGYTHVPVRPAPTTPPKTLPSQAVDRPTALISTVTIPEDDAIKSDSTGNENHNSVKGVVDAKKTSDAAGDQSPAPRSIRRESLLDILRDAAVTYEPTTFKERMIHSLNADARQAEHDQAINTRLDHAIALAENELVVLGDGKDGVDPVIIELNQKGGAGKSPNATTSAVTLAANNDQVVFVIDSNQVLGSTLQYLGIEETLGMRDSMKQFREDTSYAYVRKFLGHHPLYKNLYGIDSDPKDKRHNNPIDLIEFYNFAKGLKSACHTLIFDNGNEVINAQTLVGLELSDVYRFVTIPSVNDANRLCKDTMDEIRILYPEKVANAVLTISACHPKEMDLDRWAEEFSHPREQICLIPYDPILKPRIRVVDGKPVQSAWVVDRTQFQKTTYLANLERDILTFKQARKGIEARKANPDTYETIIDRMLVFLHTNADPKKPQQAEIDQAVFEDAVQAEVHRRLHPA